MDSTQIDDDDGALVCGCICEVTLAHMNAKLTNRDIRIRTRGLHIVLVLNCKLVTAYVRFCRSAVRAYAICRANEINYVRQACEII